MASTLSSTSTLAEIQAAYDDNASYAEDASTAKAAAFITACRLLLRRIPTESEQGSNRVQFDMALINSQMEAARIWLAENTTGTAQAGSVRSFGFENFR